MIKILKTILCLIPAGISIYLGSHLSEATCAILIGLIGGTISGNLFVFFVIHGDD